MLGQKTLWPSSVHGYEKALLPLVHAQVVHAAGCGVCDPPHSRALSLAHVRARRRRHLAGANTRQLPVWRRHDERGEKYLCCSSQNERGSSWPPLYLTFFLKGTFIAEDDDLAKTQECRQSAPCRAIYNTLNCTTREFRKLRVVQFSLLHATHHRVPRTTQHR